MAAKLKEMVRTRAEALSEQLQEKPYRDAITNLTENSVCKATDFDTKAVSLLDILQRRGKVEDACNYLQQSLQGMDRQRVSNWRGYIYTLLRKFDEKAHDAAIEGASRSPTSPSSGRGRGRGRPAPLSEAGDGGNLNPSAAEFVPGSATAGAGYFPSYYPPMLSPMALSDPNMAAALAALSMGIGMPISPAGGAPATPQKGKAKAAQRGTKAGEKKKDKSDNGSPAKPKSESTSAPESPEKVVKSTGLEPAPSAGSIGHPNKCKPCAFYYTKGCTSGPECSFCHLCEQNAKKNRKKEKRQGVGKGEDETEDGNGITKVEIEEGNGEDASETRNCLICGNGEGMTEDGKGEGHATAS